MPIITQSQNSQILPRFKVMSPLEIYLAQVQGCMEAIRYAAQGVSYTPPQMGGLSGQLQVLNEDVVLQQIEFKVK
ncbi:hypothetical protein D3C87_460000 [compost metagenome]